MIAIPTKDQVTARGQHNMAVASDPAVYFARREVYTLSMIVAKRRADYVGACAALGAANKRRDSLRKFFVSQALRSISASKRACRRMEAKLAEQESALFAAIAAADARLIAAELPLPLAA